MGCHGKKNNLRKMNPLLTEEEAEMIAAEQSGFWGEPSGYIIRNGKKIRIK